MFDRVSSPACASEYAPSKPSRAAFAAVVVMPALTLTRSECVSLPSCSSPYAAAKASLAAFSFVVVMPAFAFTKSE